LFPVRRAEATHKKERISDRKNNIGLEQALQIIVLQKIFNNPFYSKLSGKQQSPRVADISFKWRGSEWKAGKAFAYSMVVSAVRHLGMVRPPRVKKWHAL
jgi:hypothetical protein